MRKCGLKPNRAQARLRTVTARSHGHDHKRLTTEGGGSSLSCDNTEPEAAEVTSTASAACAPALSLGKLEPRALVTRPPGAPSLATSCYSSCRASSGPGHPYHEVGAVQVLSRLDTGVLAQPPSQVVDVRGMSSPETVEMLRRPPVPGLTGPAERPPAWGVLARALAERRPVSARYHGHERVVCPHALGWRDRRAKVLVYQLAGTTSAGPLPAAPERRWRSMFVDEVDDALVSEARWESAKNYCDDPSRMGMDVVEVKLLATEALPGTSRCG